MKSSTELSERRALVIGCGVGIVVDALINRCKYDQVMIVDNNADVLNFASKYFALSENASVITADGLEFMMVQEANTFELIVHDVFSGSFMRNNYIQELIYNCFKILSNNGILVLNVVSTVEMEVLHSINRQLQSVFKQLKCFCEGGINSVRTGALVNFLFFASKSEEPLQFDMLKYPNNDNGQNNYHHPLQSAFGKFRSSEIQLTKPKHDDKINQRKTEWLVEQSNFKSMRKILPASFWLLY
jgi:spermidine synthase